jgi:uncharacterized protein DUF6252
MGACGGTSSDSTTGPTGGNQNPGATTGTGTTKMTATLDGKAWTAGSSFAIEVSAVASRYLISGTETSTNTSISLSIGDIAGVGTYPLGVDGVFVAGGLGSVAIGATQTWNSPSSGAAGTVTITSLTAKRIAGTFSFNANAATGGATGTRSVTTGVFDVPFNSDAALRPLPDSIGSKLTATLNGQPFNAASVSGGTTNAGTPNGFMTMNAFNDKQSLLFTFAAPIAAGTFPLSYTAANFMWVVDPSAVKPAGANCCWGVSGDAGTITFTSLTKTRAKGTFNITLSPQPGTAARGTLAITNATFDMGMFHTP